MRVNRENILCREIILEFLRIYSYINIPCRVIPKSKFKMSFFFLFVIKEQILHIKQLLALGTKLTQMLWVGLNVSLLYILSNVHQTSNKAHHKHERHKYDTPINFSF